MSEFIVFDWKSDLNRHAKSILGETWSQQSTWARNDLFQLGEIKLDTACDVSRNLPRKKNGQTAPGWV
jgi:hypothetical protein